MSRNPCYVKKIFKKLTYLRKNSKLNCFLHNNLLISPTVSSKVLYCICNISAESFNIKPAVQYINSKIRNVFVVLSDY